MVFTNNRQQLRQFFFDTWVKHQNKNPLEPLEQQLLDIIISHPEYHFIFKNPEQNIERDYFPELGESNPFLHMALHLSIREQINTNRPNGINDIYLKLMNKYENTLDAEHIMMDCLAECIWNAQRQNIALNELDYLNALRNLLIQI